MLKKSNSSSISSIVAVATLAIATIGITILPDGFSAYPASWKMLTFFGCALLICAYFLIITFRRKKLYLNLSPLTLPLFLFALSLVFAIMLQHGFHSTKSFLGLGGLLIAASLSAICSSILIKINNSQTAIRVILSLVSVVCACTFISLLNAFTHIIPESTISTFYTPGLNLSLMLIGLATIGANYFKKNKFKTTQLIFAPLFSLGLIAALFLDFQANPVTPTFYSSISASIRQITANNSLNYKTLFFGSKSQIYADIYDQFAQDGDTAHLGHFYQAYSTPLTLISLYGLICVVTWLFLVGRTLWLCFSTDEANRDLYFILLVSYFVQLFTAIHPLILMVQIILIAFATNKNRQILINLSLSTFSSQNNTQKVENRDNFRLFITSFSSIASILLIFLTINLIRNYQGFQAHERSLKAFQDNDPNAYIESAQQAVSFAPDLDTTNLDAAAAYVELMLSQISTGDDSDQSNELALGYYEQAIAHAQKAIDVEPTHAANYYTYAQIMQEAYPYLQSESDRATLASRINTAYAQAALYQPTNPTILLGLGDFYNQAGQYDTALEIYQTALKLDPESAQANYQLATLYEQQNELDSARNAYTNTLHLLEEGSDDYLRVQAKIDSLSIN